MGHLLSQVFTKVCYYLFGVNISSFIIFFLLAFLILAVLRKNGGYIKYLVVLLPPTVIFLRLLLNDYFLSDDFDHFKVVSKFSFIELFIKGLTTNEVWAFHRLFFAFWVFKLIFMLFGTNYYAFLTFNFLLHLVNLFLFERLLSRIGGERFIKILVLFLFGFYYLGWVSNIHELLAMFFFLITFNFGLKLVLDKKVSYKKTISIMALTYFLGVSSKEVVFLLPYSLILFLLFYHNYVKKINLRKSFYKLLPIFAISLVYLLYFAVNFSAFSEYEAASGYKSVLTIQNFLDHVSFFLSERIPILTNVSNLSIWFMVGVILYDYFRKKLLLTPLYVSFLIILTPAAVLTKYVAYYSYIPSIFLYTLVFVVLFEIYKRIRQTLDKGFVQDAVLSSISSFVIVFVFSINLVLQENCFLLQYPRDHARKVAIQRVVTTVEGELSRTNGVEVTIDLEGLITEESNWFLSNSYLPYFIDEENAQGYEFKYLREGNIIKIIRNE